MRDPNQPDTQPDQYLPDAPNSHTDRKITGDFEGVNPRQTSSMPRGEDDEQTRAGSVEYNDRTDVPEGGTKEPPAPERAPR
jgi:hypothetical protein